jgi:hypothetical protein
MTLLTPPRLTEVLHFRYANALVVFLGLVMIGAHAQNTNTANAPELTGRMVDIGGYKLHLDCARRGHLTVVDL